MPIRLVGAIALVGLVFASQAASADPRRGLDPLHQPVVANGVASVPGCPDWSDADHHQSEAQFSNFGCATASNLAAMIADPMDLVRGRSATGPDAETATKAIKAWRAMPPSGAGGIEKTSSKGN